MCDVLRRWAGVVVCAILAGCGGGGADSGESIRLSIDASREMSVLERQPLTFQLRAGVDGAKVGQVFYVAVATEGGAQSRLISDIRLVDNAISDALYLDVDLRTDIPAGRHEEVLSVAMCSDAACAQPPAGGPVSTRIIVNVKPNIAIVPLIELTRSGADAAPGIEVRVDVPGEAGEVALNVNSLHSSAIGAELAGHTLRITTQQVRAGTYELPLDVYSTTQPGYQASTTVRYTVLPPSTGEQPMTMSADSAMTIAVADGQLLTRRITLQKASWSSAPIEGEITNQWPGTSAVLSLVPAGDDAFDLVIDTRGAAPIHHSGLVRFRAAQAGELYVNVSVAVASSVSMTAPQSITLDATTVPADARWSTPVTMVDGAAIGWSATVSQPWLKLTRPSGVTGRDSLDVEVDPTAIARFPGYQFAHVDVVVDRAGVQPVRLVYTVSNNVPAITVSSPGALVGAGGKIYLSGFGLTRTDLVSSGMMTLSGATLSSVSHHADPRFVGDYYMMVLDVVDAVPGTPVTVTLDTPLLRSSVTLPVRENATPSAGHAKLPLGERRPPSWSSRENAWAVAGNGMVYRLGLSSGTWELSATPLPGVVDVDWSPDETVLLALTDIGVRGLHPTTLSTLWSASPDPLSYPWSIDTRTTALQKSLANNASGSVFASMRGPSGGSSDVVDLIIDWRTPLSTYGQGGGYHAGTIDLGSLPMGIASSASRTATIMSQGPQKDSRYVFRTLQRRMTPGYADDALSGLADGLFVLSSDDAGSRVLTSDGHVYSRWFGSSWLAQELPSDRTAMGYTLTGDGQFGLVYSAILSGSGDAEVATEPQLAVIDLRGTPWPMTVLATLPITGPVGCGSPRGTGETCRHLASLVVDPKSRMVLVSGPRGMTLVPLPETVRAASYSTRGTSVLRSQPRRALRVAPIRAVPAGMH
ncbi:hypothetical protein BURC_02707 [Burkholderiaceae bacterium]|nr:hypothetical protein BURC_02707 [Burkholderiaceae bacterium]